MAGADFAETPGLRSFRRRAAPSSQSPSKVTSRYCQPPQPGHKLWQHRLPAASAAALPAPPPSPVPAPASTAVEAPFRAALDATLPSKGFLVGFDGTGGFGAKARPAEAKCRNPLSTPCAPPRLCESLPCTPPLPPGALWPWSLSSGAAAATTTTCEGSREVPRSGAAAVLHLKGPTASRLISRRGQVGETMLGRVLKGCTWRDVPMR